MKHLVIGLGEVGLAIQKIFNASGIDEVRDYEGVNRFDVMHICFPYFEGFETEVKRYRDIFKTHYTVIHSTVPIGTSEKLGVNHSPIRGKHPHLFDSIKTFIKFIGGPDASTLGEEFQRYGIPTYAVSYSKDTEAMKLWDTTQYGVMILLEKEIYDYCQKHGLNFDTVYTEANLTYNKGYQKMGIMNVQRPILKHVEGKIGGHCVVQNCHLLDSDSAKRILSNN